MGSSVIAGTQKSSLTPYLVTLAPPHKSQRIISWPKEADSTTSARLVAIFCSLSIQRPWTISQLPSFRRKAFPSLEQQPECRLVDKSLSLAPAPVNDPGFDGVTAWKVLHLEFHCQLITTVLYFIVAGTDISVEGK